MSTRVGVALALAACGLLAIGLPVVFAVTSCVTTGAEQVCRSYPNPGGYQLVSDGLEAVGVLAYWLLGPALIVVAALLLAQRDQLRLAGGVALVGGLAALAVAPLTNSCVSGSDYQICETTAAVVVNVAGIILIVGGASALIASYTGNIQAGPDHKISV